MSTLPGNPHADEAEAEVDALMSAYHGPTSEKATARALLAVAHELRTLALIGYHDSVLPFNAPGYEERGETIATRLGLGGEGQ